MKIKKDSNYYNRLHNSSNPFQGKNKRVLCVCSAGLLRSPTAAFVLSQKPYDYNTRAAGIVESYALVPVDGVLLSWAQEIVCMSKEQHDILIKLLKKLELNTPVINLDIPDTHGYRAPALIKLIKERYKGAKVAP